MLFWDHMFLRQTSRLFFTRLLLDCTLDRLLCALEGKGGTSKCLGETCWPIVEKQDLKNGRGQLYMVFWSVPGGLVVNICLFWGHELWSKPCGSGYVGYYRFLDLSLHLYTQNLSWAWAIYVPHPLSNFPILSLSASQNPPGFIGFLLLKSAFPHIVICLVSEALELVSFFL